MIFHLMISLPQKVHTAQPVKEMDEFKARKAKKLAKNILREFNFFKYLVLSNLLKVMKKN